MASLHKMFRTDPKLETEGIYLNYGEFKIKIARAGGANKAFTKALERKTRPVRRALQAGSLDEETLLPIMKEIYAETVVLGWEGVTDAQDEPLSFSKENCLKLFNELPDLFSDIMEQANKWALFRDEIIQQEAKN